MVAVWVTAPEFAQSFASGETRGSRESLSTFPAWIMKGMIPLGFLSLGAQGVAEADDLFGKKAPLNSLHQEVADNFYPERADFTITRSIGSWTAAGFVPEGLITVDGVTDPVTHGVTQLADVAGMIWQNTDTGWYIEPDTSTTMAVSPSSDPSMADTIASDRAAA